MAHDGTPPSSMPEWYLPVLRLLQVARRGVYDIELALRRAMALDAIDPRLLREMESVRDALGAVKVCLSVMDLKAEKLLEENAVDRPSGLAQAAAR